MKRNIYAQMATGKKVAATFIVIGIIFALVSLMLFTKKDIWHIFPRMDIAWIGFCVVAIITICSGITMLLTSYNKQSWINQTDEMEMAVLGKAYTLGYIIQTTLLGLVFFLLTFMGYLNKVSGFSIIGIVIISGLISWIYSSYLRTHGIDS